MYALTSACILQSMLEDEEKKLDNETTMHLVEALKLILKGVVCITEREYGRAILVEDVFFNEGLVILEGYILDWEDTIEYTLRRGEVNMGLAVCDYTEDEVYKSENIYVFPLCKILFEYKKHREERER